MADDDAPNRLENEFKEPAPAVPLHHPLPPPPEVLYTRPRLGKKSSTSFNGSSGNEPSDGWIEASQAVNHGAGLAAGLTFVTSIVAGALLGNWIDQRWDQHSTMPWATLVLTLVGAVVGFVNLQRLTARSNRNNK